MSDLLTFDKMITPKIITIVYYLLLLGVLIGGLGTMFMGMGGFGGRFVQGLLVLVFGSIGVRIWCELLIVLFKMNEALQELRSK
jgi:hypothetical protein